MSVVVTPRGTHSVKMPRGLGGIVGFFNGLMLRIFKNREFQNANVAQLTAVGAKTAWQRIRNAIAPHSQGTRPRPIASCQ